MERATDPLTQCERRRHRRKPVSVEAEIVLDGSEPVGATLLNLSTAGALAVLERPLPIQAACRLRFQLPAEQGDTLIEATAVVVRMEIARSDADAVVAALEFTHIEEEDQAHIHRFGQTLFRPEALAGRHETKVGDVVLKHPALFSWLTLSVVLFGLMLIALFIFGSYARRSTVAGELVPDTGLIKVYAQQPGIAVVKHVKEGQVVRRGDALYTLSGERYGKSGAVDQTMNGYAERRRNSLRDEIDKTRLLQQEEARGLERREAGVQAELSALEAQVKSQRTRVEMAQDIARRYKGLLDNDYVSYEQAQQKQEELLDQRARLYELERNKAAVLRELAALQNELSGLKLKQSNQLAGLERAVTETEQELTERESKRSAVIVAPEDGTIASVHAEVGQTVAAAAPVVSLVPLQAKLEAQLYAPSGAVAFVKPGMKVSLRYQTFPYQKFGIHEGVVTAVTRSALPLSEFSLSGNAPSQGEEPVYRIKVRLPSQSVMAEGAPQPLQAGMKLEADLMQHRRNLYEWVFEPLSGLARSL